MSKILSNLSKIILLSLLFTLAASARPTMQIPEDCQQMIVVTNSHWDDPTAVMKTYQRASAEQAWTEVGKAVHVNLGRTGLAWGESPLMKGKASQGELAKREGDGRSPAGLFPILKAFGHPSKPQGYSARNLPFLVITDEQCVDDKDSAYYNQVVRPSQVGGRTWNSAETMKIDLYRMGLVIGHNCPKAKASYGSCIFFHIQRGRNKPTAGCTSMTAAELSALLLWLRSDAKPIVLQLPKTVFEELPSDWPGQESPRTSWFQRS